MTILLQDIWPLARPEDYKAHFARWNGTVQPLEVLARDRSEWQGWQEYWPGRDDFNRPFVFAMAQVPQETDAWMFGGVFEVTGREGGRYQVRLRDEGSGHIGRLKLGSTYRNRSTRVNFENHYRDLVVLEVLREPYAGRFFPGFEDIDVSFEELETIVGNSRLDWRAALQSVKGVYLITDTSTKLRYVGSACGDQGIWSRWCAYLRDGHGGNAGLRELVPNADLAYCRRNFRFALLEHRSRLTPDHLLLAREEYWKRILFSRHEDGLNRN